MTAWTTPRTWAAGVLAASDLNTDLRDNTLHLYERVVGYAPTKSSNQTKGNATYADIDDLSFPCADGKHYTIIAVIKWSHSTAGAGDGPGFAVDYPGGTFDGLFEYTGNGSSTGIFRDWQIAADSAAVSQNDAVDGRRMCRMTATFTCSSSGTFKMRVKRFSAGTLTVYAGSSLFITSD